MPLARAARAVARRHRRAVTATRADALDGVHLWVTLTAPTFGRLAAVEDGPATRVEFSVEVAAGRQTVVVDLTELPEREGTYRVVFSDKARDVPLQGTIRPFGGPTCAPASPDGRWHHTVRDDGDGLFLVRTSVAPVVWVTHVGEKGDHLEISWSAEAEGDLVLTDNAGEELTSVPSAAADGEVRVRLGGDLAITEDVVANAGVRVAQEVRPLMRRRNDLLHPEFSVLMPVITTPDTQVKLRWARGGRLQVVRKAP